MRCYGVNGPLAQPTRPSKWRGHQDSASIRRSDEGTGGSMATARQVLGRFGETIVAKECACPKCKRSQTLKRLPNNFKCADLICDFCGYLAQVKAATVRN